jgi:hypothetical protein
MMTVAIIVLSGSSATATTTKTVRIVVAFTGLC